MIDGNFISINAACQFLPWTVDTRGAGWILKDKEGRILVDDSTRLPLVTLTKEDAEYLCKRVLEWQTNPT